MDRETEYKQWEFCEYCGQKKVPHPKIDPTLAGGYRVPLVCPNDVPRCMGDKTKFFCTPPPILAAPFINGAYYRGNCRNATIARYNAETNRFVYWRQKFGSVFAEDIGHRENDDGFDIFEPFAIVEDPPFEIPLEA
jgi:hypothetical protein